MERKWWKEAVVYQIYPRSFCDSNGDGIGDLGGISARLDYLRQLGVDVLWLSPVYASPNADNGYDISDYRDIMPEFGSLSEMDELIAAAHRRGLRLIMDLVPNHTSDEHPWFVESRRRESPYRDYYYWRPGRGDAPPNNWEGFFGGSTWTLDPLSGEYYLHLFTERQPDLNWENPRVRQDIYAMVRWWLDRGVDGFRIDCANLMSKAPGLPDGAPIGPEGYGDGKPYFVNGPRIHEFLRELNEQALSGYDVMTVGETSGVTPEVAVLYVNEDRHELNMVFHFEHMDLDRKANDKWVAREWRLTELKDILRRWYEALRDKGWNSFYLNNHDQPRAVSRFADDGLYRVESAKLLATLTLTLPGTPFLYQGEEIGMTNIAFGDIGDYRDVDTFNAYHRLLGRGLTESEVYAAIHRTSRDNARTPMQWNDGPAAGFTAGAPWIKVNPNYPLVNVASAQADPHSVWHYYRTLIDLRREHPALVYGDYQAVLEEDDQVHAYLRCLGEDVFLVVLNFTRGPVAPQWPNHLFGRTARLLVCNYPVSATATVTEPLRPFEARLYRVE